MDEFSTLAVEDSIFNPTVSTTQISNAQDPGLDNGVPHAHSPMCQQNNEGTHANSSYVIASLQYCR